jgi:hypothetical protein
MRGLALSVALTAVLCGAGFAQAQSRRAAPSAPAAQEAPPPADLTADAIAAWRKAQVDEGDYFHAFDWEDHARYVRPANGAKPDDPQLRLWVREEYFKAHGDDDGAHRSNLSLVALDCPLGRLRTLTSDAFPKLNLGGEPRRSDAQDPEWEYPRPESVEEQTIYYGCVLLKRAGEADR